MLIVDEQGIYPTNVPHKVDGELSLCRYYNLLNFLSMADDDTIDIVSKVFQNRINKNLTDIKKRGAIIQILMSSEKSEEKENFLKLFEAISNSAHNFIKCEMDYIKDPNTLQEAIKGNYVSLLSKAVEIINQKNVIYSFIYTKNLSDRGYIVAYVFDKNLIYEDKINYLIDIDEKQQIIKDPECENVSLKYSFTKYTGKQDNIEGFQKNFDILNKYFNPLGEKCICCNPNSIPPEESGCYCGKCKNLMINIDNIFHPYYDEIGEDYSKGGSLFNKLKDRLRHRDNMVNLDRDEIKIRRKKAFFKIINEYKDYECVQEVIATLRPQV